KSLVDEKLSPRGRTICVQPFIAHHLQFRAEVERGVGIDQQQRMVRSSIGRCNGHSVRPAWLDVPLGLKCKDLRRCRLAHLRPVECLEIPKTYTLDIATDAALGEAQRHPRLKALNDARLHIRMLIEVVIKSVSECNHELLQPRWTAVVFPLQVRGIDKYLHSQILVHLGLTLGLSEPTHRVDVIRFDAIEVVLRLGVFRSEHSIGIGLTVNVRDTPVIANDVYIAGLALPRFYLALCRCISRKSQQEDRTKDKEVGQTCRSF